MTLETDFVMGTNVYGNDKEASRQAEHMLNTIAAFAKMDHNAAFWTDGGSNKTKWCIAVNGDSDVPTEGECIKCKDIEKVVRAWCYNIAEWCISDMYTDSDGDDDKIIRIKIEDIDTLCGGFSVFAIDKDGRHDGVLHILPCVIQDRKEALHGIR